MTTATAVETVVSHADVAVAEATLLVDELRMIRRDVDAIVKTREARNTALPERVTWTIAPMQEFAADVLRGLRAGADVRKPAAALSCGLDEALGFLSDGAEDYDTGETIKGWDKPTAAYRATKVSELAMSLRANIEISLTA